MTKSVCTNWGFVSNIYGHQCSGEKSCVRFITVTKWSSLRQSSYMDFIIIEHRCLTWLQHQHLHICWKDKLKVFIEPLSFRNTTFHAKAKIPLVFFYFSSRLRRTNFLSNHKLSNHLTRCIVLTVRTHGTRICIYWCKMIVKIWWYILMVIASHEVNLS